MSPTIASPLRALQVSQQAPTPTLTDLTLDNTARERIGRVLKNLPDPSADPDMALAVLHKALSELPTHQLQAVLDFGRHADTSGVGWIQNLPVDPTLPATPTNGGPSANKDTYVSEGLIMGLSGLLGEPVGVTTEKSGQLIHDVIPVAAGATSQTNQSSAAFLNFHNDIVYDDCGSYAVNNPDFLVLLCVRADPEGQAHTYYADARDVSNTMDDSTLATLRQPLFRLNAPGSYCRDVGQEHVLAEPAPVITGPMEHPEISVSANGVTGLTTTARDALDELQKICRDVAHRVTLQAGQALLINNRKGLHARSQFPARHDGTDRWLQRTYVRRTTWPLRYRLQPGQRRVY